ncbi:MAG: tRNA preQ1(34) S-adenosylmethionine ribosyltransferase-isomerase QueA [Deltaproteobacteria bacterium]
MKRFAAAPSPAGCRLSDYDYYLPEDLIAQRPASRRDGSRLMVVDKRAGTIAHRRFGELPGFLRPGDLLVINDAKVVRARLLGRRASGGRVEVLVLGKVAEGPETSVYRALIKPLPRLRRDEEIFFEKGFSCRLLDPARRLVAFRRGEAERAVARVGHVPLPPYIRRDDDARDRTRYQTVYARAAGAVAAPTAGLHFTRSLLDHCVRAGGSVAALTLHVGYGTFAPVRTQDIDAHRTEPERYCLPARTVDLIRRTRRLGGRVIAVGTTTCKALEDAAGIILGDGRSARRIEKESALFIRPPYRMRVTDGIVTNFHLPRTTLLMLVAAFAGRDLILRAYAQAVERRYRFYSYGDAMLIL